jgi:hypothetical protein
MKPKLQCESVGVLKIAGIAYHLDPYFPKSDWREEFHQLVLVPYISHSSPKMKDSDNSCLNGTQKTLKLVLSIVHLITLVPISAQLGNGFIIKHSFSCKNFVMILTFRNHAGQYV